MSRDRNKHRIPTSAELEERGDVSPPEALGAGGRTGGILKRLFRAGRFRVSEDVAARKHVAPPPGSGFSGVGDRSPDPAVSAQGNRPSGSSTRKQTAARQQEEPEPSRRRTIRIDDSVKERRGLGRGAAKRADDA
jgi:hypothetical protein